MRVSLLTAAATFAVVALPCTAQPVTGGGTRAAAPVRPAVRGMVQLPTGDYRPLYAAAGETRVHVASFAMDRTLVTRSDFLSFVIANAAWRRGNIRPVFAEASYLGEWPSATSAGAPAELQRPATSVSWFAARAFCASRGKRLPTVDEWEYAAAASDTERDAADDPLVRRALLALYSTRASAAWRDVGQTRPNVFGVQDLHALVWEWTLDFNSVVVADDSRATGSGQDARDHHLFCASSSIGATDASDYPAFSRYAVRAGLTARSTIAGVGFRCASDRAG